LNPEILNSKALGLSLIKNFESAISFVNLSIELKPKKITYKANRGIILARASLYSDALVECDRVIEQAPHHEIGYYAKACYFALQGEVDLAIDSLQKAIDIKARLCKTEAKHNPDFDGIRDNARFQELVYREI
jgi:tetratricopeptide (TPR) repeat protein